MIKVMVVEDDPMVMNYNCRFIEKMDGFQVAARARNGVEAKDIIDDPENDIDLVILDIFMPLMNGLEFLTAVRGGGNLVDVIFLTAANDTAMINRAMNLGLFDDLSK
ncbi:MAG: response regulator, partial [Planctomycetes bacterium]|nr:response regulator [Planctomycetota bacterium]